MANLHFVMFPWVAHGHLIPMVDIARMLAQRGVMVIIITTPTNINHMKPSITRATEANLNIQVLEIQLPFAKAGLPEGCETFETLPSRAFRPNLFVALKLLEEPAEEMLRALNPPPSCIISDFAFPWTSDVAKRLNIPRIVFYVSGCFTSLCVHIVNNTDILDEVESDSEYFALPGMPDRIEVTKPQVAVWRVGGAKEITETFKKIHEVEKDAFGIVIDSFEELEPKYVEELEKAKGKKVWCVGPVSLCNKSTEDILKRGNNAGASSDHDSLKWLDSREPGSVVYICFGTHILASADHTIELALGLESSNTPFLWVIGHPSEDFERWVLEQGYEERIKDRGLIVRGWAPQILILSHQSVGGFMLHCGWNSTLEAVCAGKPVVTWPHFAEQFLNERFLVNVLKIGVKVGSEVPVFYQGKYKSEVMVKREAIKTAVQGFMSDAEEAETRRKRTKELGEMAKRAMEEGGSSHLNMTLMIEAVTEELNRKTL